MLCVKVWYTFSCLGLVTCAVDIDDFDKGFQGYEFLFHDNTNLGVAIRGDNCYYLEILDETEATLNNEWSIMQTEADLIDIISQNDPRRVRPSTLDAMRNKYQDRLADFHCIDKNIFELYTGELNPCDSGPCLNNGTCTKNSTVSYGYVCSCTQHFEGDNCQKELNPCDSGPCLNGGNCTQDRTNSGGYTCRCPQHYVGSKCQTELNPCDSGPCQNGGTCTKNYSVSRGFTCTCPRHFTGHNCQTEVNPCDSGPCQNGGTCTKDYSGGYTCICPRHFVGHNCQTESNPCDSGPCQHGGTCTKDYSVSGGHTCTCPQHFEGHNCAARVCPFGWSGFRDSCYWFIEYDVVNYHTAKEHCQFLGGYLVEITSDAENSFVQNMLPVWPFTFWIGLQDKQQEGRFVLPSTHQQPGYTNWDVGEPNNAFPGEDCVNMHRLTGFWFDVPCITPHPFVCEK